MKEPTCPGCDQKHKTPTAKEYAEDNNIPFIDIEIITPERALRIKDLVDPRRYQ